MAAARWNEPFDNRRHAQRVGTEGTGVVHLHGRTMSARIVDLSTGGVRLQVARWLGLGALDDARVVVELRLDARRRWQRLTGTVRRVDTAADELVIAFGTVPTDFEDLVQDELVAALETDRAPRVLLVDGNAHRRSKLTRTFGAAGCRVAEARAPLEALSALNESKQHFSLIAIADTIPAFVAEEFRRFVADVHPELTNLAMRLPRPRLVRSSAGEVAPAKGSGRATAHGD